MSKSSAPPGIAPFTRAMVMAAGLGTRMRPLTIDRPKPLVPVRGKPLVDYTLDRLAAAGVTRAVVNVHYKADMMEAHLRTRAAPDIIVSDERAQLMDTGGGLVKAAPHLGDAPIFYANTDAILVNGMRDPLGALKTAWRDNEMDALLLLAPTVSSTGYSGRGDFLIDQMGRLSRRPPEAVAPFVWTGVQILHPRILRDCPDGPFSTNLLWNRAIEAGRAFGVRHDGLWMHVGCPQGLKEAERRFGELERGHAA